MDELRRGLERDASPDGQVRALQARVRSGDLDHQRVKLAAYVGSRSARVLLGWKCDHAAINPDGMIVHNADDPSGRLITEPCNPEIPCGLLDVDGFVWGLIHWPGATIQAMVEGAEGRVRRHYPQTHRVVDLIASARLALDGRGPCLALPSFTPKSVWRDFARIIGAYDRLKPSREIETGARPLTVWMMHGVYGETRQRLTGWALREEHDG